MKHQKKNTFFTLVFSFMPGAAEMYMGFMKSGISIMGIFFLSIIVPSILHSSDVLVLLAFLIWFFAFFHARNLAACDAETMQFIQDCYVWEEFEGGRSFHIPTKVMNTWGAWILVVLGVTMLWGSAAELIYRMLPQEIYGVIAPMIREVPQIVLSVLIIIIGLRLIRGKKKELEFCELEAEKEEEEKH